MEDEGEEDPFNINSGENSSSDDSGQPKTRQKKLLRGVVAKWKRYKKLKQVVKDEHKPLFTSRRGYDDDDETGVWLPRGGRLVNEIAEKLNNLPVPLLDVFRREPYNEGSFMLLGMHLMCLSFIVIFALSLHSGKTTWFTITAGIVGMVIIVGYFIVHVGYEWVAINRAKEGWIMAEDVGIFLDMDDIYHMIR